MSDAELAEAAEKTTLFARLSPAHKQRIIRALQSKRHVVGFLGDGINDAPALRAADVGISVDTAVDIAKESADVILLEKSLMVLEEGVLEGRKVFANILKYVRMGASSNFGNMFSVLGASAFCRSCRWPPIQILTNNLLYDFSQVPIPTDDVDPEQIAKPRPWHDGRDRPLHPLHRPVQLGLRLHHLLHDALRLRLLEPTRRGQVRMLFQTGWFVESLLDADADHPRHPHQPHPLPPEPGQLAADRDHGGHHGLRHCGCRPRPSRSFLHFAPLPGAVLAAAAADPLQLCRADAGGEDVADPQGVDLDL